MFFLLLSYWPLSAQEDLLYTLDSIEITASKLRSKNVGGVEKILHSATVENHESSSLDQLLNNTSGVFIKSYGSASLATASIRGGNAGQILVLWNGLPIHSPMLGQLDLSLLPLAFIDEVSFQPGGGSATWGNAAVTGVISLSNHADFSHKFSIKLKTQLGSYNQRIQNLSFSWGNAHLKSTTRFFHQAGKNDFPYVIAPGQPVRHQLHNEVNSQGIFQSINAKLKSNLFLDIHLWLQNSDREIPPLITQNESKAAQQDHAFRNMIALTHQGRHTLNRFKVAYFDEKNLYQDSTINLSASNKFSTLLTEVSTQFSPGRRWTNTLGFTSSLVKAKADAYRDTATEFRGSLFATAEYTFENLTIQGVFRQSILDQDLLPLVPSLGIDLLLSPTLNLKGKVSRDYKAPTLNDRYWVPGGDLDLLAERGWSEELGLVYNREKSSLKLQCQVTFFNRNIVDWIFWTRQESQAFFSPQNIAKVWSRGIEQEYNGIYTFRQKSSISLGVKYSYTRSTNEVPIAQPKMERGDQLIYTPLHQGQIELGVRINRGSFHFIQSFSGSYQGINKRVEGYQLGSLRASYNIRILKTDTAFFGSVQNLWNVNYQIIENRPMPGTNYRAGLQLQLSK